MSSSSDDDVYMNEEDCPGNSSASDDDNTAEEVEDVNDDDDDEEEDEEEGTSSVEDSYRSSMQHLEDLDDDDEDYADDALLDDGDLIGHKLFSRASIGQPSPIPWPPAIVSQQNQLSTDMKPKKPGIIYLSSIPPGFNVTRTISFFSQFGKVGRVFLQPDLKEKAKRRDKLARNFTEGWVEFLSKRNAKEVAASLNTTQVGGSKRSKAHDIIWNIKYLPRFKWTHLSERLAYERASHTQKMSAEVSQAKREADFFRANVEKSKRIAKQAKKEVAKTGKTGQAEVRSFNFPMRQKEPENVQQHLSSKVNASKKDRKPEEKKRHHPPSGKQDRKRKKEKIVEPETKRARTRSSDRKEFLSSVFGSRS